MPKVAAIVHTRIGATFSKSTNTLAGFNTWWENLFKQEILSSRLEGCPRFLAKFDEYYKFLCVLKMRIRLKLTSFVDRR